MTRVSNPGCVAILVLLCELNAAAQYRQGGISCGDDNVGWQTSLDNDECEVSTPEFLISFSHGYVGVDRKSAETDYFSRYVLQLSDHSISEVEEIVRVIKVGTSLDTKGHISSNWLRDHSPESARAPITAPFADRRIWAGSGALGGNNTLPDDDICQQPQSDPCGEVPTDSLNRFPGSIGEGIGCDVLKNGTQQCRWRSDGPYYQDKFPYSYGAWLYKRDLGDLAIAEKNFANGDHADYDHDATRLRRTRFIIADEHTYIEVEMRGAYYVIGDRAHAGIGANIWPDFANSLIIREHK
jgi:hypothetical protein